MYQTLTPEGRMQFLAHDPAPSAPSGMHAGHGEIEHKVMRGIGYAGLGAGAIAMAPILAKTFAPSNSLAAVHATGAISYCGSSIPTGIAASVSNAIAEVPVVGPALASGGMATIGASAGLAIGGMLVGSYLDKHQKAGSLPWGKIVRWGCLITSALIAAPMVISGLSMGLFFFGQYLGMEGLTSFAMGTLGTLGSTPGALTGASMASGTAGLMIVHALTCALPMGLAAFLMGKKEGEPNRVQPTLDMPEIRRHDGRVMPQPQLQAAIA